jgi:PAS domain S-box-containing protein
MRPRRKFCCNPRSIGDGVITTDAGQGCHDQRRGETLTGWSSREAIGQPLKAVFNIAIDLAAQARARQTGFRNEAQSILVGLPLSSTLTSRDGTEHIIEQVASPIRDRKNEVAGVVLVFRDITERQRTEAERRKAEALEQLGLLAGGIAHDFNNLLTAIIGNISLATLLLPPSDEMATRLRDAKNASMRARDLAQQLLTFARGGAPIKKTASIGKLIQDTVRFSPERIAEASRLALIWSAEIDAGQTVTADLAAMRPPCRMAERYGWAAAISFTITRRLRIPDLNREYIGPAFARRDGIGKVISSAFDPYLRRKKRGTGLVSRQLIRSSKPQRPDHGIRSRGSTFTVYLPAFNAKWALNRPSPLPKRSWGVGNFGLLTTRKPFAARSNSHPPDWGMKSSKPEALKVDHR